MSVHARAPSNGRQCGIFWDLDGDAIPPVGMLIGDACEALRAFGLGFGELSEFKAFISPASDSELSQATRLASDLQQNGVSLSLHRPPGTVILVSSDHSTLGYPLSLLRNRSCEVIVLSPGDLPSLPNYVHRLEEVWDARRGQISTIPHRASSSVPGNRPPGSQPLVIIPPPPPSSSHGSGSRIRPASSASIPIAQSDPSIISATSSISAPSAPASIAAGSNTPTGREERIPMIEVRSRAPEISSENASRAPPTPSSPRTFDRAPGSRTPSVHEPRTSPRPVPIAPASPWSFSTILSEQTPTSHDSTFGGRVLSQASTVSFDPTNPPAWPPRAAPGPGVLSATPSQGSPASTILAVGRGETDHISRYASDVSGSPMSSLRTPNSLSGSSSNTLRLAPIGLPSENVSPDNQTRGFPASHMAGERLYAQLQPSAARTNPLDSPILQDPNYPSPFKQATVSVSGSSATGGFNPPGPSTISPDYISFRPLVIVLERFRALGTPSPLRSAVGSELRAMDPRVYEKAGVKTFKEYAGLAERKGIVTLVGGSPGKEKITLSN